MTGDGIFEATFISVAFEDADGTQGAELKLA